MILWFEPEENPSHPFPFDPEALARRAVDAALAEEGFTEEVELSVNLVDSEEIRRTNREQRGIDAETDVLSFPMLDFTEPGYDGVDWDSADRDPENDAIIFGDIVLCVPRVFSQAEEYGHSVEREYAFLIVHSMLHLMGYDHMEDGEREQMEERQRIIMERLGISR